MLIMQELKSTSQWSGERRPQMIPPTPNVWRPSAPPLAHGPSPPPVCRTGMGQAAGWEPSTGQGQALLRPLQASLCERSPRGPQNQHRGYSSSSWAVATHSPGTSSPRRGACVFEAACTVPAGRKCTKLPSTESAPPPPAGTEMRVTGAKPPPSHFNGSSQKNLTSPPPQPPSLPSPALQVLLACSCSKRAMARWEREASPSRLLRTQW